MGQRQSAFEHLTPVVNTQVFTDSDVFLNHIVSLLQTLMLPSARFFRRKTDFFKLVPSLRSFLQSSKDELEKVLEVTYKTRFRLVSGYKVHVPNV